MLPTFSLLTSGFHSAVTTMRIFQWILLFNFQGLQFLAVNITRQNHWYSSDSQYCENNQKVSRGGEQISITKMLLFLSIRHQQESTNSGVPNSITKYNGKYQEPFFFFFSTYLMHLYKVNSAKRINLFECKQDGWI